MEFVPQLYARHVRGIGEQLSISYTEGSKDLPKQIFWGTLGIYRAAFVKRQIFLPASIY